MTNDKFISIETKMTLKDLENKLILVSLSNTQRDYVVSLISLAHELGRIKGARENYTKTKEILNAR